MGLFWAGLLAWYGALRPSPLPLGSARQRRLHHTGVFPNLQAMGRPSLFPSPLLVQLQKQLEAQIKDPLGQRVRALTGATGEARDLNSWPYTGISRAVRHGLTRPLAINHCPHQLLQKFSDMALCDGGQVSCRLAQKRMRRAIAFA
jgi:hypothetical protein